jgi:hypothetical protein
MFARRSRCIAVALAAASACSRDLVGTSAGGESTSTVGEPSDAGEATSTSTSTTSSTSTTTATSAATTGDGTSDTDASDDSAFLGDPDVGADCDLFSQNCPAGQKCMPWAINDDGWFNATKCSPIAPDPKEPGEPCTVEGDWLSGVDDCDLGSMCWYVDTDTNMGECLAMCTGEQDSYTCEDPCKTCFIYDGGFVQLCFPSCDPVLQDCEGNTAVCFPYSRDGEFLCGYDQSGTAGGHGDPCTYTTDCDPGLFCADADRVPGCDGKCCTPYCDPTVADACAQVGEGVECVPWPAGGGEYPGCIASTVGTCVLP